MAHVQSQMLLLVNMVNKFDGPQLAVNIYIFWKDTDNLVFDS